MFALACFVAGVVAGVAAVLVVAATMLSSQMSRKGL